MGRYVAVAILDTMWDWEAKTSEAGYAEAPRWFRINARNHSGRRLYDWLGHRNLLVTDACKELVTHAKGKGKPDKDWLRNNLAELWPFELLLVCGRVAQATYELSSAPHPCRIIECPHPAARAWTNASLAHMRRIVQEGTTSVSCEFNGPRLRVTRLIPF